MEDRGAPAAGNAGSPEDRERLQRARACSVFIATPIARHPVRQYTTSLSKTLILLQQLGIRSYVQHVIGNSNVPRARNELVAAFMASSFSHLLFVDDDMGWGANDVLRVLASEQDVVAGVGVKKSVCPDDNPDRWCMRTLDPPINQDAMGAIEVEAVGTGFMRISRRVFEAMAREHPDWKRRGWATMPEESRAWYYQFFRFDPNDPEECSEDVAFCREWRRLGGQVWIDPTIKLLHVGEFEYTGNIDALLEALPDRRVSALRGVK